MFKRDKIRINLTNLKDNIENYDNHLNNLGDGDDILELPFLDRKVTEFQNEVLGSKCVLKDFIKEHNELKQEIKELNEFTIILEKENNCFYDYFEENLKKDELTTTEYKSMILDGQSEAQRRKLRLINIIDRTLHHMKVNDENENVLAECKKILSQIDKKINGLLIKKNDICEKCDKIINEKFDKKSKKEDDDFTRSKKSMDNNEEKIDKTLSHDESKEIDKSKEIEKETEENDEKPVEEIEKPKKSVKQKLKYRPLKNKKPIKKLQSKPTIKKLNTKSTSISVSKNKTASKQGGSIKNQQSINKPKKRQTTINSSYKKRLEPNNNTDTIEDIQISEIDTKDKNDLSIKKDDNKSKLFSCCTNKESTAAFDTPSKKVSECKSIDPKRRSVQDLTKSDEDKLNTEKIKSKSLIYNKNKPKSTISNKNVRNPQLLNPSSIQSNRTKNRQINKSNEDSIKKKTKINTKPEITEFDNTTKSDIEKSNDDKSNDDDNIESLDSKTNFLSENTLIKKKTNCENKYHKIFDNLIKEEQERKEKEREDNEKMKIKKVDKPKSTVNNDDEDNVDDVDKQKTNKVSVSELKTDKSKLKTETGDKKSEKKDKSQTVDKGDTEHDNDADKEAYKEYRKIKLEQLKLHERDRAILKNRELNNNKSTDNNQRERAASIKKSVIKKRKEMIKNKYAPYEEQLIKTPDDKLIYISAEPCNYNELKKNEPVFNDKMSDFSDNKIKDCLRSDTLSEKEKNKEELLKQYENGEDYGQSSVEFKIHKPKHSINKTDFTDNTILKTQENVLNDDIVPFKRDNDNELLEPNQKEDILDTTIENTIEEKLMPRDVDDDDGNKEKENETKKKVSISKDNDNLQTLTNPSDNIKTDARESILKTTADDKTEKALDQQQIQPDQTPNPPQQQQQQLLKKQEEPIVNNQKESVGCFSFCSKTKNDDTIENNETKPSTKRSFFGRKNKNKSIQNVPIDDQLNQISNESSEEENIEELEDSSDENDLPNQLNNDSDENSLADENLSYDLDDDKQMDDDIGDEDVNKLKKFKYYLKLPQSRQKVIACIIRCRSDCVPQKSSFICSNVPSNFNVPELDKKENYASYIFEINANNAVPPKHDCESSYLLAMPFNNIDADSKYVSIVHCNGDSEKWTELHSTEMKFEDSTLKFIECKLNYPNGIYAAVTFTKTDSGILDRDGLYINCSSDSNIVLEIPENAVRIPFKTTIQATKMPPAFWDYLVEKCGKKELENIILASSILSFEAKRKKLMKPGKITFHLPEIQYYTGKTEKKTSANAKRNSDSDQWENETVNSPKNKVFDSFQKSLIMPKLTSSKTVNNVKLLNYNYEEDKWGYMDKSELHYEKDNSKIYADFQMLLNTKYMLLRSKFGTNEETSAKAAKKVNEEFLIRNVCIALFQSTKNPRLYTVLLTLKRLYPIHSQEMIDNGFILDLNNHMTVVELHEYQLLKIKISGNLENYYMKKDNVNEIIFHFYSLFPNYIKVQAVVKNKINQRALNSYHGYIDIYTLPSSHSVELHKTITSRSMVDKTKWNTTPSSSQVIPEQNYVLIKHLLLSVKKKKPKENMPFRKGHLNRFHYKNCLIIIKKAANEIGDSWYELGLMLGINDTRLQSIKFSYSWRGKNKCAEQMLIYWLKGCETYENKLLILKKALSALGRPETFSKAYVENRKLRFGC